MWTMCNISSTQTDEQNNPSIISQNLGNIFSEWDFFFTFIFGVGDICFYGILNENVLSPWKYSKVNFYGNFFNIITLKITRNSYILVNLVRRFKAQSWQKPIFLKYWKCLCDSLYLKIKALHIFNNRFLLSSFVFSFNLLFFFLQLKLTLCLFFSWRWPCANIKLMDIYFINSFHNLWYSNLST